MLNPGELSQGHQKLNDKCNSCHKPFTGIEATRCISCHKPDEIGLDTSIKTSFPQNQKVILFHARLKTQECTSCHTDHKGRDPKLSIGRFDHSLLAAQLQSNCSGCHAKPEDKLHIQVTADCENCHNTKKWEFKGVFDHEQITGANKSNCNSCHQKPSDTFHQSLQDNCSKCHSTDKWLPSSFNHSSYFLLDRDHNVKCNTCHANNNFSVYTCYGCHEHSENKIRKEHNEHGIVSFTDCASCHRSGDKHDIRQNDSRKKEIRPEDAEKIRNHIKSNDREEKEEHDD